MGTQAAPLPPPAAAPPLQVTVAPTHPSHWLVIFSIMAAVLQAETPLLLQILPNTASKAGVVGGSIGLDAIIAGLAPQPAA